MKKWKLSNKIQDYIFGVLFTMIALFYIYLTGLLMYK